MKKYRSLILGLCAIAIGAVAYGFPSQHNHSQGSTGQGMMQGCGGCGTTVAQKESGVNAKVVKGVQQASVTVTQGKYSPSTIKLKKGMPVELAFKLGANPGCGDVLVIKDLKVKKELSAEKAEVVKFTPKKAGTIEFTCGMGMFKGKIVVQ